MTKKIRYLLIILPVLLLAAACSSLKLPGTSSSTSAQQTPGANFGNQTLEDKLAVGTLKLEGTANAITAAQAKTLLPLWKAAKSLSSSSTTSADEINALYKQIEEAMTADQLSAIKGLTLAPSDFQTLMQQYGVQAAGPGGFQGTPDPTRMASRSQGGATGGVTSGGGTGGAGGGPVGAGGPPGGDFGGGVPPDAAGGQPSAQGTPAAGQAARSMRGGMNIMFVDPLIKILQTRAGG